MGLLKLGFVSGAIGAVAYGIMRKMESQNPPAAFAKGQGAPGNATQVRDAGPAAMRDGVRRPWTKEDQASDESFPASDPPATY